MKAKIFLIWILSALFSISGYAKVETVKHKGNWVSYSEFNNKDVKYFFVGALITEEADPVLQLEIEMTPKSVPNDLRSVKIILKDDYSIYTDAPRPYMNEGNKVVKIWLDQDWNLFGWMFGEDEYYHSASKAISSMVELSKYDIKSIEFTTMNNAVTTIAITTPTTGMFKEMFKGLISAMQADNSYGNKAKEFFAPYLKEFPLNGTAKSTTKTPSSSSTSTPSKTTPNNTTTSKSTASKSTTTTKANDVSNEILRSQLKSPFSNISSDIYFYYPKVSEELKRRYGKSCKAEYDKHGKIYVFDTNWYKIGGYATSYFCIDIYCDHTEWDYIFPKQKTLSDAKNFCNSLATKIKALGIELIDEPSKSFPIDYKGDFDGKKIRLSACLIDKEYYISLEVSHPKEVSKSDLNPVLTIAELFERPLGAPKGINPVYWFVVKGFAGEVDSNMTSIKKSYSRGSNNTLRVHIPVQGSAIYKGLESCDYKLTLADRSAGHSGIDLYTIEFSGETKDGIYSWNIKSKQEKQEMKYLWNQFVRELMMQGHKLVKANKKTTGFSEWNPQEGYLEQDGKITRRYILTKKNHIVVQEQKPYPAK